MRKLITYLFTFFYLSTNAADIFVYPGATSPDFSSISVAVDSASDGDRILVSNGSYFGDININSKSISILPVVSSNKFTVQGDIIFNTDSMTSPNKVTISTAEIIGNASTVYSTTLSKHEFLKEARYTFFKITREATWQKNYTSFSGSSNKKIDIRSSDGKAPPH